MFSECACSFEGCGEKMQRSELEKHAKECEHRVTECDDCSESIRHSETAAHDLVIFIYAVSVQCFASDFLSLSCVTCPASLGCLPRFFPRLTALPSQVCQKKLIACSKCNASIQRQNLDGHEKDFCLLRPVSCTYAALGCTAKLTHQSLPDHLKETDHVGMMMTSHMALMDKVRNLETKAVQGVETFTANVVWKMEDVARKISQKSVVLSDCVSVGGDSPDGAYSIYLEVQFGKTHVGIFLNASFQKGCQIVPIEFGGSSLTLGGGGGREKLDVAKTGTFGASARLTTTGAGLGYANFLALEAVELDHCSENTITIEASIRIKNRHYVAGELPAPLPIQLLRRSVISSA
jgi:hypothetical protein